MRLTYKIPRHIKTNFTLLLVYLPQLLCVSLKDDSDMKDLNPVIKNPNAMAANLEVVSTRTVEKQGEKRHVSYSVLVKTPKDFAPIVIERRYTDFLELYRSIRSDQNLSILTSSVTFPKKVLLGNFTSSVISTRSAFFQVFLRIISDTERLRESPGMIHFLIGIEEKEAIKLLRLECYSLARPLLLKVFTVLNKIYTERHPAVILALLRLVACSNADDAVDDAKVYGELAIRRFESVSDIDLLEYYVPLLQMCVQIWWNVGRDKKPLEARLNDFRRQGHRVDGCPTLMEALLKVEPH